jgi:hypothetical protein
MHGGAVRNQNDTYEGYGTVNWHTVNK